MRESLEEQYRISANELSKAEEKHESIRFDYVSNCIKDINEFNPNITDNLDVSIRHYLRYALSYQNRPIGELNINSAIYMYEFVFNGILNEYSLISIGSNHREFHVVDNESSIELGVLANNYAGYSVFGFLKSIVKKDIYHDLSSYSELIIKNINDINPDRINDMYDTLSKFNIQQP